MEPSTIALGSKREGQSILVTAAGKGENNNASASKAEIPLPSQLKRILKEVARTGACSWLSWEDDYRDIAGPGRGKSKNLQMLTSATTSSLRQSVSTNRGIASSSFSASASGVQPPPRKKHRNTIHKSNRMRFMNSGNFSKAGSNRKRPLLSIRPHLNTAATGIPFPAPGSACSGRTSGSEPDDSTQYECDSEGTSTTTTSEVSVERQRKNQQRLSVTSLGGSKRPAGKASMGEEIKTLQYHMTLQEAFRSAVEIVLDHFYRNRGGYKLSPAERCRNEALRVYGVEKATGHLLKSEAMSPEEVFHRRRERLVGMLRPNPSFDDKTALHQVCHDGPPFTIQRIAEVLVAPERYYSQTHKLCNCLEKLLLITSSTGAFGGNTGGGTSQNRREKQEMTALANEKERQKAALRQRCMRRKAMSPCDDAPFDESVDILQQSKGFSSEADLTCVEAHKTTPNEGFHKADDGCVVSPRANALRDSSTHSITRESLEAAARASLRTKFDHVGTDPHSFPDRDTSAFVENRAMTNSPPPPRLLLSTAPSNIVLSNHVGASGLVRQQASVQNSDYDSTSRVRSPILFQQTDKPANRATTNSQPANHLQILQLHHAVALAGVSIGTQPVPFLEQTAIDHEGYVPVRQHGGLVEGGDADAEHGRSSASNSDVDSESDDISLDDSASDRSDGSDSGSAVHYEPFTAARAMALNRMQQQQRLQSRVLTSLNSPHQSEGFRPPADSEYQSGDSIDSMRAEDSGGSDSSSQSSDIAD